MQTMQQESKGLSLLKKRKQGIVRAVFSRLGIIVLLLILQVVFLFSVMHWLGSFLPHLIVANAVFVVVMVFCLLNSRIDPTAKITWLFVIMLLPVFGALLFWYTQSDVGFRALKRRIHQLIEQTQGSVQQSLQTAEELAASDLGAAPVSPK